MNKIFMFLSGISMKFFPLKFLFLTILLRRIYMKTLEKKHEVLKIQTFFRSHVANRKT